MRRFFIATTLMLAFVAADRLVARIGEARLAQNPLVLMRDGERVVLGAGAVLEAAAPRWFGTILVVALPAGGRVTCDHVWRWTWCDGGWEAAAA